MTKPIKKPRAKRNIGRNEPRFSLIQDGVPLIVISHPHRPFSTPAIVDLLIEKFSKECAEKDKKQKENASKGKKTAKTVRAQLNAEIRFDSILKSNPFLSLTSEKPPRLVYNPSEPHNHNFTVQKTIASPWQDKDLTTVLEQLKVFITKRFSMFNTLAFDNQARTVTIFPNNGVRLPCLVGLREAATDNTGILPTLDQRQLWAFVLYPAIQSHDIPLIHRFIAENFAWARYRYAVALTVDDRETLEKALTAANNQDHLGLIALNDDGDELDVTVVIEAMPQSLVNLNQLQQLYNEQPIFAKFWRGEAA